MLTPKEFRVRQMILAEYRSGTSREMAFTKITTELGYKCIPGSTFDRWYRDFLSGDNSLFEKNSKQHDITQVTQVYPNGEKVKSLKNII